MRTVLASAAVLAGAAFMFVAGLGVLRLPDLYTRLHAATKASTVGVVAMLCGVGVAHVDAPTTVRALLVAAFFLLTAPVAAHAIARSAHAREVPLAPGTRVDLGERPPGKRRAPPPRERHAERAEDGPGRAADPSRAEEARR